MKVPSSKAVLMDRLRQNGPQFSGKQRVLANFIRQNYYRVAFMTAAELAAQVKASPATVVRFADALGYEGYPALKHHLHQIIQDDLSGPDLFALHLERKQSDALRLLVQGEIENISNLWRDVSIEDVNRVAKRILRAKRVFVAGLRAESGLAQYFGYHLGKIHPDVNVITADLGGAFDRISKAGPYDVLVAICFPRYARGAIEVADFARQTGLFVAAVTDGPLSPLTQHANVAMHARAEVVSFVDSFSAPQVLLTSLLVQVALKDPASTKAYLNRFERIAKQQHFFYSKRERP